MKTLGDYDRIIITDLETTGLEWEHNKIIDIGALILEKNDSGIFEEVKEFNYLINHGIPIPPKITELTHITQEMVDKNGKSYRDVMLEIAPYLLGNTLFVAYNAQFEINFYSAALRDVLGDNSVILENDILDPYVIYKDKYPYPHRLETAIATMGVQGENSHRAIDDVRATLNVLRALVQTSQIGDVSAIYLNVLTYNPKYGTGGLILPHINYIPTKGGKFDILSTIKRLGLKS